MTTFLDLVRKAAQERKQREYVSKGGKGSGWFGPPKGTHGGGAKGTSGESKIREIESKVLAHMLTREAAYIFDPKGKSILQKSATSEKPYEIRWEDDEIAKMKDATFTHNHPLTGGSFSESDVIFAAQANLAEIRAIGIGPGVSGKRYLYKLTRPEKGWGKQEKIEGDIGRIDEEVMDRLWAQVKEGKLRPEQAEFTHNHNVMQALASANGWKYAREEL